MKYYVGPWVKRVTPFEAWAAPAGTVGLIDFRSLPGHTGATNGFFAVSDDVTLDSNYRLFGQGYITSVTPAESDRSVFASMLGMSSVSGSTLMDWVWDALTLRSDPAGLLRVRPIMPTTQRDIEVHLGGHSVVRRERFDLNAPHAANVIVVLQEEYRQIRRDALDGKVGLREPDPQFHRRVLDYWGEKFGVDNPEDIFIPAGVPRERRLKHATTLTESFNKANSSTLGPDLTWGEPVGDFSVVSNQLNLVTLDGPDAYARAEHDLSSSDHRAELGSITLTTPVDTLATLGVTARFSASAVTCYLTTLLVNRFGVNEAINVLYKVIEEVNTVLADPAWSSYSFPASLRLICNGSTISNERNGSTVTSLTDTAITGGTRGGVSGFRTGSGVASTGDSFEAADLAVAASRARFLPALGVA